MTAVAQGTTTRLCVKGVPKYVDEARLREHFAGAAVDAELTDVKIVRTRDGRSRQMAFVGFKTTAAASAALRFFDQTFLDTQRLTVEEARKVGDGALPRPWSKHSEGSSANAALRKRVSEVEAAATAAEGKPKTAREAMKAAKEEKRVRAEAAAKAAGLKSGDPNDPAFQEFMELMQPRNKQRLWADSSAPATAGAGEALGAAPMDKQALGDEDGSESDGEYQEAGEEGEEEAAEEAEMRPAAEVPGADVSDMDYLKMRTVKSTWSDDEEEEEEEEELWAQPSGTLPAWTESEQSRLGLERLQAVVRTTSRALTLVSACAGAECATQAARSLARLSPLLTLICEAHARMLVDSLRLHRSSTKLSSILGSLFTGLVLEGFCASSGKEGDATEGQEGGQLSKDQAGTGLGEGEGAKDVSGEIENEDQVLGMEDMKQQEGDEDKKEPAGEDDGIEMQQDFEGTTHDIDLDNDEASPEEQEAKENLEKEMGDGEDEDGKGEVLDEKLWDGEEGDQGKNEEFQKDAPGVDQSQVDPNDLETKAGEDGDADKPQDELRPDQEDEDPKAADKGKDQKPADEGEEGDNEAPEYDDTPDGVQQENQNHKQLEKEEELELPDDMMLDGDEADEAPAGEQPMEEDDALGQQQQQQQDQEQDAPGERVEEDEEMRDGDDEADGEKDGGAEGDEEQRDAEEEQAGAGLAQEETAEEPEGADDGAQTGLPDDAAAHDPEQEDSVEEMEAGPRGMESGAAARADESMGLGGETEEEQAPRMGAEGQRQSGAQQSEPPPASSGAQSRTDAAAQNDAPAGTAVPQQDAPGGREEEQQREKEKGGLPPPRENPLRKLGDALEAWKERLNLLPEMPKEARDGAGEGGAEQDADEYEFVRDDEAPREEGAGEPKTQALAQATEEQAQASKGLERPEEEPVDDAVGDDADKEGKEPARRVEEEPMEADEDEMAEADEGRRHLSKRALNPGKGAAGTEDADEAGEAGGAEDDGGEEDGGDAEAAEKEAEREAGTEARVSLRTLTADGEVEAMAVETEEEEAESPEEAMRRARADAEEAFRAWHASGAGEDDEAEAAAAAAALWSKLEAMTGPLAAELTEQLRLILEPTLAARLQGDFRTGKRLNMRKIIPFLASDFQKDKIWLRRARPSARRYQVVLALDDSRSMSENSCGALALESLALISRAMARLEVGEVGVVSFGEGGRGMRTLHPLGAPLTERDGPALLRHLRFRQENTVADQPVLEMLQGVRSMLAAAHDRASRGAGAGGSAQLQQLVLVVADGRFHEKERLRLMMRQLAASPGLLVAFIAIDNPAASLLNLQSVAFKDGAPVFSQYLDSFPFPFYTLVQSVETLPQTLAELLKQWLETVAQ